MEGDSLDGIDQDFTFIHPVPPSHLDVRMLPDPDTASDEPAADAFPETFGEDHWCQQQSISILNLRRQPGEDAIIEGCKPTS